MRYKPLASSGKRRGVGRPVALIGAGADRLEIWSDAGAEIARGPEDTRALLSRYKDHRLFSVSALKAIRGATGPEGWQVFRWNRSSVVWQQLDGVRIVSSRGVFDGLRLDAAIPIMLDIAATAESFGIGMGSWSSMARQLWRSTLDQPVALTGRKVGKRGFFGGRKQCVSWAAGAYHEQVAHVDLKGAYPAAMFAEPFPTRLVKTKRPHIINEGISRAVVHLPTSPWVALPERTKPGIVKWEGGRELEGWWPNRELRMAVDMGGSVEPLETWEGVRMVEPFLKWGSLVHQLRERPGPEAKWWKGVSNSLWGTFAMSEVGGIIYTLGPTGFPVSAAAMRGGVPPPTAAYIAALTTARVRERVYREGLGNGWHEQVIYVDTDGIMVLPDGEIPEGAVDSPGLPGEWVVDKIMPKVYIRGTQAFAWWDDDGGEHVTLAGVQGANFQRLLRLPVGATVIGRGG